MARVRNGAILIHLAAEMDWRLSDVEEAALADLQALAMEGSLHNLEEQDFRDLVDFALRVAAGVVEQP